MKKSLAFVLRMATSTLMIGALQMVGCGSAEPPPVASAPPPVASAPPPVALEAVGQAHASPPPEPPAPVVVAPRSPAEVAREGNHLKGSSSVYLAQHAHNPLDWYPWGPEALERSVAEEKPIFLSIGYASCHWCHVMEHEVFEKEAVARYMNEHFISIKVDREERPDLDSVYMDAVVSMTGRGGWPMTVFLTPSLQPFFGGTYFPQARFMGIARDVLRRFKEERSTVEAEGLAMYEKIAANPKLSPRSAPLSPPAILAQAQRVAQYADPEWGGLGKRTKFPTPIRWGLMLHAYRHFGDEAVGKAVRLILDRMADGGINDHIGGGFHRYTVERTWLIPHFEKMLYDNAQLAPLYIEAEATFDEPRFGEVARSILDFMIAELYSEDTAFFASYDADSGGHEGTFYIWTPAQLKAVAGDKDGEALAWLLGVTERGNFEGANILTRRMTPKEVAAKTGRRVKDIERLLERWRKPLYDVRTKRVWPGLDKKVVTAWNGLAIGAFARGYIAYGDARYRKVAEAAGDYLWRVHRVKGGGFYRVSNGGKASEVGVLDDYTFVAVGFLDLFQATGDLRWLERAVTLVDEVKAGFSHEKAGWYLTGSGHEAPMGRVLDPDDAVRPSGISSMVHGLLRLAAMTGESAHHELADTTSRSFASQTRRKGMGMAGWWDAALMQAGPYYEVIIAGSPEDRQTRALMDVMRDVRPSWTVLITVPEEGPDAVTEQLLPPTFGKKGKAGGPLAYVCQRGICKKPTADVKRFRAQLTEGWVH